MDCGASRNVVITDSHVICKLLASENETNLVDVNSFLLLQGLLDLEDGVVLLEVVALLSSCQGTDQNLHDNYYYSMNRGFGVLGFWGFGVLGF